MNDEDDGCLLEAHLPCDDCGSSDALALYSNGWSNCFSCGKRRPIKGFEVETSQKKNRNTNRERSGKAALIPQEEIVYDKGISARHIDSSTCRKWKYGIAKFKGEYVHVANLYDVKGSIVGQKLRTKDKEFPMLGDYKSAEPLYGMHLWPGKGKKVVLTEGEIDVLTVSMLQKNQWSAVSIPNAGMGAGAAKKAISKAYDWLDGYEQIILMLDMDNAGREAVDAIGPLLPHGKTYVAHLPYKDANECLLKGEGAAVTKAIFDATPWAPEAVVSGVDAVDMMDEYEGYTGLAVPWDSLKPMVPLFPTPSVVTILAGTGSGKTTFCKSLEHYLLKSNENVGIIHIEEDIKDTVAGIVGLELGRIIEPGNSTKEERREAAKATVGREGVYFLDSFGSMPPDTIMAKIRYFATVGDCKYVLLDHISILLSGLAVSSNTTANIDKVMTDLVSLAKELNICIIVVSHLTKSGDNKPFEEGGQISLQNARGSQSIAQLSYICLGLERNQQAEKEADRDVIVVRVLKNRSFRKTGAAMKLVYDHKTGRLLDFPMGFQNEDDGFSPEPDDEGPETDPNPF